MILYVGVLKMSGRQVSGEIASGAAVRGEGGVAGEEKLVSVQRFIPGVVHHAINKYPVSLDVQRFLWTVY